MNPGNRTSLSERLNIYSAFAKYNANLACVHRISCYQKHHPFLYENDCSQLLHYCLLRNAQDGFFEYADCTPQLSNRILRHLDGYTGFTDFCMCLMSKDLAYTCLLYTSDAADER